MFRENVKCFVDFCSRFGVVESALSVVLGRVYVMVVLSSCHQMDVTELAARSSCLKG